MHLSNAFTVSLLCSVAHVSRSSYYKWLTTNELHKNKKTLDIIQFEQAQHFNTIGYRNMKDILKNSYGIKIGKNKVYAIMKQYKLQAVIRRKKFKYIPSKEHLTEPNILNRMFKSNRIGEKYVVDITYLPIPNKMVYLAACIDLCTRDVIAYNLSLKQVAILSTDLINKLSQKRNLKDVIIHTDQGVHFTNHAYVNLLKENGVLQSMSRRGNCWDNAIIENFFGHFKCECYKIRKKAMKTYDDVSEIVAEYIDYYNTKRSL